MRKQSIDESIKPVGRRKKGTVRKHVLECATRLFSEKGYAAVTLRDIVDASGIHMPGIYRHFKDKRSLYLECAVDAFQRTTAESFTSIAKDTPIDDVLFALTCKLCQLQLTDRSMSKLLLRQLVDEDYDILQVVTSKALVKESNKLVEALSEWAPRQEIRERIYGVYALVFGFAQFKPILKSLRWKAQYYQSAEHLAIHILQLLFPESDWTKYAERRSANPHSARGP